jgi:hypothetical protein
MYFDIVRPHKEINPFTLSAKRGSNFTEDFKRDAVAQITERGYPVSEVSKRPEVSPHSRLSAGPA